MNFDFSQPYPSARSPVFARNVVATSQPLATQAGLDALKRGGNACDAALAAAITLTVVEPNNNGLGSDAFALIHDGRQLHGLNASGRSPAKLSPAYYEGLDRMPTRGWPSVTVPGAVSAWVALSERFGRLPFERLFDAAIDYARNGFLVGPKTAPFWAAAAQHFADFPAFQSTFVGSTGAPKTGEVKHLPDHATSLQDIASSKGRSFYHGRLAQAMVRDAITHDYPLTMEDLGSHRADWVEPVSAAFAGARLNEIPPNSQGLMALIALKILRKLDILDQPLDSALSIHLQVEAIR
ncbi:MAG: gamma-glutamyltransferase, partial [Pseudomonadales bacterium]